MIPAVSGLRVGSYVAVVAAVAGFGLWVVTLKHKADRTDAAEARAEQIAADFSQRLRQLESERNAAQEASDRYAEELIAIREHRPAPRVVRVCPDGAPVRAAPGAATGTDALATGAGTLPEVPRPDIGPRLYADAERADELSAQLRALQGWIAATR